MTRRRRLILELLATEGPLTRSEAATKFSKSLKNRWSSLIQVGWIEPIGTRRDFSHGDESELLDITEQGRIALTRPVAVKPNQSSRKSHAEQWQILEHVFAAGAEHFNVDPGAYVCLGPGEIDAQAERNILIYVAAQRGVTQQNIADQVGFTNRNSVSFVIRKVRTAIDHNDTHTVNALDALTSAS